MFDALKKIFSRSTKKLAEKVSKPEEKAEKKLEKPVEKKAEKKIEFKKEAREKPAAKTAAKKEIVEKPAEKAEILERPAEEAKEKKGFFGKLFHKVTERRIEKKDIDEFFSEIEGELLQANVALEVVDNLRIDMDRLLAGKEIKRGRAENEIKGAFEKSLLDVVKQGSINLENMAKAKRPLCLLFLGFNGSGKTTTIAKVANWFLKKNYRPVFAAGDTFRAASIEQLEVHGNRLGVKTIKHQYGADSAAVIFDAKKHAEASGANVVLADTAGRTHVDKNLMDELSKIVRVNKPDLKVLVIDSLTGNDAVEQAKKFNETIGVDCIVLTKMDVNKKGGALLSVCWAIKKPVLFLGVGQGYDDLELFEPEKTVKELTGLEE